MTYSYGTEQTVIVDWGAKLRVGIGYTTSETDDSVTISYSVIGDCLNYQGFPHHKFNAKVNGSTVVNQTNNYTTGTFPGYGVWYTSPAQTYSNTIVVNKTNAEQTVSISAEFGTAYAYLEPNNNVYVSQVSSIKTVSITIPKRKSGAHVKVNGTWKEGRVYVKVNGTWKEGEVFAKVNGEWKKGV